MISIILNFYYYIHNFRFLIIISIIINIIIIIINIVIIKLFTTIVNHNYLHFHLYKLKSNYQKPSLINFLSYFNKYCYNHFLHFKFNYFFFKKSTIMPTETHQKPVNMQKIRTLTLTYRKSVLNKLRIINLKTKNLVH